MSLDPRRLERHLRESLRRHTTTARADPFTCFLHPATADPALNVAIPDEPLEGRRLHIQTQEPDEAAAAPPQKDEAVGAALVKAHFVAHGRRPRIEFLDECHPGLAEVLQANGFREEGRTSLLGCTRASWRQVDPPPGVRIEPLLPDVPWKVARQYLQVQREAYKLEMPVPEEGPPGFWPALALGAGLLVLVDGEPAAAGGITPHTDGLSDVRGLAVRDAYRRRGLGAFLLSALGRVAHETGVEALLVIPEGPGAQSIAERAGFAPVATLRSFAG